jgi:hypothetical protein
MDRPTLQEAKMLVNRTSLLTLAAVTTLAMAATGADAGSLCSRGGGGFGGYARAYSSAPRVINKVVSVKPRNNEQYSKPAYAKGPAADSVKSASVASAAKATTKADAADAGAAGTTKLAAANSTAVKPAPVPAATATKTCFAKEYLDNGTVRFSDTCTKEWAINSTNVETKTSKVDQACLTKENNQNGVVMFKDTCTGEWAMNTADQFAQAK